MIETGQHVVDWVAARTESVGGFPAATGIGLERGGNLIAGVVYNDWNGVNICMHVAAVPGRKWLNREYLWFCFYYPFLQVGAKRITGLVGEGNEDARRFDEHLGFKLEARLEDAHPTGALLVYVLREEDCRWLAMRRPAVDMR
jgi:RimJ/RimL family protein N-acetyltransferase